MASNEGPLPAAGSGDSASPSGAPRPAPAQGRIVLVLTGPIARADVIALCERAETLLRAGRGDQVLCDVAALDDPDAVTVDALARLALTARRLGRNLTIRGACGELRKMLAFAGLDEVLPCGADSGLEPWGQPEEREQARGVEEEADPGDPIP
jgi:ABC-type transporter Mla MlaB component